MRKLFLIPVLALIMCVSAWATDVASLSALQAALTAGGEITLTADIDAGATELVSASTTILDLNGQTLSGAKEDQESGVIKVTGGSLTINATNGGIISAETKLNAVCVNGGTLTINAGTFNGSYEAIYGTAGTININGGSFTATEDNAVWAKGAALNITGGNFDGAWYDVQSDAGSVTRISGGAFAGNNDGTIAVGCYGAPDLVITGGTFNGTKGIGIYNGAPVIRGGSFGASPAAYVDYSVCIVTKPESLYIVAAPATDVVAFNKNKFAAYTSLTGAVSAASKGDVIYMYQDDEVAVALSKFITINTNGHDVNLSAGEGYALNHTDNTYTLHGVAVLGSTDYTSVAAAVEAASKGDVITLWADAPAVTVSKTILVNANGFNASAITAGEGYSRAATNGGYVFGNVSLSKSDNVYTVSNFDELYFAIYGADAGDEIQLANDIAYPATQKNGYVLNITKSITLNGNGHSLTGYGTRSSGGRCALVINDGEFGTIDVTIKNITIEKSNTCPLSVRGKVHSLTIDNSVIDITNRIKKESYSQGITISGDNIDDDNTVTITNSVINNGHEHYPVIFWVPVKHFNISNSTVSGWCSLYFKGGTSGTVVNAENCVFSAQNHYSGTSNSFGAFVLEDDGINISLDNCTVDCTEFGDQTQTMFLLSEWKDSPALNACSMTITGDNSQIIGHFFQESWTGNAPVTFTIMGGTYFDEDITEATSYITIPSGYEKAAFTVTNNGVPTTIYRVRKEITTSYNINQDVESQGPGLNENTEFKISGSTEDQTLTVDSVVAHYVEVSDNATLTIPEGKVLEVTNGLDVTEGATLVVESGSTLKVGEGGVTSENSESIVIEANESGSASFLLNPEVIVNTTPNLTVKMLAKQIGKNAQGDYYWHRFAMPVEHIDTWTKQGGLDPAVANNYPTYLYGWDYANNDWLKLTNGVSDMVPLLGYTLTLASDEIGSGINTLQDVTYIFKGNLVGNTNQPLNFQAEGFNFFGNSYTGYIDVLTLIEGFVSNNVEGTVYMWCNDPTNEDGNYQSYVGVPLYKLQNPTQRARLADWQKEVAPMQTFILRLRGADSANEEVDYASTIWGNPRYGNSTPTSAPARVAAVNSEEAFMEIVVKAADGKGSRVDFTQDANHSDAFESGYDVVKYMNERTINLYASINGEDFSSVVTNTLNGKLLSLQTNDDVNYTMSFKNVEGTEYAILDHTTNQMTVIAEGNTYQFAAQPNSTIEGRFEIVSINRMPTAIENTEVKASAKGIYTITGQYVGENFEILPAGVYVVDGVKIVK